MQQNQNGRTEDHAREVTVKRFDMKLVVPHAGEMQAVDIRLMRLAEFLGVRCEPLRLTKVVQERAENIERAALDQNSCLVINPKVLREWVAGDVLPAELVSALVLSFPYVLVHALTLDTFAANLVAVVSGGKLQSVQPITDVGKLYEISSRLQGYLRTFFGALVRPYQSR